MFVVVGLPCQSSDSFGCSGACLCEAFEQLSQEGRAILKGASDDVFKEDETTKKLSARAARRNELHHATIAGKGGLLLDFSEVNEKEKGKSPMASASSSTSPKGSVSEKPAATWDLLDCRSWLLDASRRIAQSWDEERKKGTEASKKYPQGKLEDLEGQLVEHSITLCENLESELKEMNEKAASSKRITPRVNDMSKLGIKWQNIQDRRTGGKLGIAKASVAKPSGRTAGQILLLKTAKKLGSIMNDDVAGEAFHKELRAVVGQQETRKRQQMRDEATRQRLQQMKRKPWLQARIQA